MSRSIGNICSLDKWSLSGEGVDGVRVDPTVTLRRDIRVKGASILIWERDPHDVL